MTDSPSTPIDIDSLRLRVDNIDTKPIDFDTSEGYPDTWDYTEADLFQLRADSDEFASLRCCHCDGAVLLGNGALVHEDTDEDEDHEPEFEDFQFVSADSTDALFAGTSHGERQVLPGVWVNNEGPMMNYLYPVSLDISATDAAVLIADLPLCIVEYNDDTHLALTGGGMDLSWEICKAYIRLGSLPPTHFSLPRMSGMEATQENLTVVAAMSHALSIQIGWLQRRLEETQVVLS